MPDTSGIVIDGGRLFDGIFTEQLTPLLRSSLQQSEFNYVNAYEPKKNILLNQVEQLNRLIQDME